MLNTKSSRGAILIVDDEPAVAEMLRDIFMAQGYAVDGASNGGDALMLASLSRPDAIILDIKLPARRAPRYSRVCRNSTNRSRL